MPFASQTIYAASEGSEDEELEAYPGPYRRAPWAGETLPRSSASKPRGRTARGSSGSRTPRSRTSTTSPRSKDLLLKRAASLERVESLYLNRTDIAEEPGHDFTPVSSNSEAVVAPGGLVPTPKRWQGMPKPKRRVWQPNGVIRQNVHPPESRAKSGVKAVASKRTDGTCRNDEEAAIARRPRSTSASVERRVASEGDPEPTAQPKRRAVSPRRLRRHASEEPIDEASREVAVKKVPKAKQARKKRASSAEGARGGADRQRQATQQEYMNAMEKWKADVLVATQELEKLKRMFTEALEMKQKLAAMTSDEVFDPDSDPQLSILKQKADEKGAMLLALQEAMPEEPEAQKVMVEPPAAGVNRWSRQAAQVEQTGAGIDTDPLYRDDPWQGKDGYRVPGATAAPPRTMPKARQVAQRRPIDETWYTGSSSSSAGIVRQHTEANNSLSEESFQAADPRPRIALINGDDAMKVNTLARKNAIDEPTSRVSRRPKHAGKRERQKARRDAEHAQASSLSQNVVDLDSEFQVMDAGVVKRRTREEARIVSRTREAEPARYARAAADNEQAPLASRSAVDLDSEFQVLDVDVVDRRTREETHIASRTREVESVRHARADAVYEQTPLASRNVADLDSKFQVFDKDVIKRKPKANTLVVSGIVEADSELQVLDDGVGKRKTRREARIESRSADEDSEFQVLEEGDGNKSSKAAMKHRRSRCHEDHDADAIAEAAPYPAARAIGNRREVVFAEESERSDEVGYTSGEGFAVDEEGGSAVVESPTEATILTLPSMMGEAPDDGHVGIDALDMDEDDSELRQDEVLKGVTFAETSLAEFKMDNKLLITVRGKFDEVCRLAKEIHECYQGNDDQVQARLQGLLERCAELDDERLLLELKRWLIGGPKPTPSVVDLSPWSCARCAQDKQDTHLTGADKITFQ